VNKEQGDGLSTHPDPGFVQNLEWQLRTALRRESRFARPLARAPWRGAKLATIVFLAVAGGASGTLALQQAQRSRVEATRIHGAIVRLKLSENRLDLMMGHAANVQAQVQSGIISTSDFDAAQAALALAQVDVKLRQLDLGETTASGRAPDDALFAPCVDGRDFVTERIDARLALASDALAAAKTSLARIAQLVKAGATPESESRDAQTTVTQRETESRVLAARKDLRRRFLAGELTAARVDLEERRAVLSIHVDDLAAALAAAAARLEQARTLQAEGFVSSSELADATLAFEEARGAVELNRDELTLVEAELARTK